MSGIGDGCLNNIPLPKTTARLNIIRLAVFYWGKRIFSILGENEA
jgi:hypothetical protein